GNQRTKESSRDFVDTLQDRLEKIRDEAIRLQESLASKRKKQATSVELNEDDYVWLRPVKKGTKLGSRVRELKDMAASEGDEYVVDGLVDHRGDDKETMEFLVHWAGYDVSERTWEPLSEVDDTIALDEYLQEHPELVEIVGEK
ncbi:hypothetical protein ADUPG1_004424, partial [Aduncisulcus paluster]